MTLYVFLGPTLSAREARAELDAVYLPPVAQGDVYRIARDRPRAIGIVDGYFERVPAVWHKEILWALTEGVRVFGSASMGALRAAELAPFGMEGVGAIFEAYRDGVLLDDDEVAVAHGASEAGYAPHSEAMVNIRATLAAAESSGVLRADTRALVERVAKDLFYPDRAFPLILRRAAERGASPEELAALAAWLPAGRVDRKRADALTMLRRMRAWVAATSDPKPVSFRLERTLQWERAVRHAGVAPSGPSESSDTVRLEAVLDELGLAGDAYLKAYQATLLGYLALREAERRGLTADTASVERMHAHVRQVHGVGEPADFERWLEENHLGREGFDVLMREESLRGRLNEQVQAEVVGQLPDHLRLVGAYGRLLTRARRKQRVVEEQGVRYAEPRDAGISADELLRWYFARLGKPVPDDIEGYARAHAFGAGSVFLRAVLHEYCYVRSQEPAGVRPSTIGELARTALSERQRRDHAERADREPTEGERARRGEPGETASR